MAPHKLMGLLFLLLVVCLTYVHSGKSKKTIKIHVPYYVKHVHHYKKVYVPKVQVVKHEHVHKKEHEHHHHHDHGHSHHEHYDKKDGSRRDHRDFRSPYDVTNHEDYDSYYDELGHRSYSEPGSNRLSRSRKQMGYRGGQWEADSQQLSSAETSEEFSASSSQEDGDYISDEDEGKKGTLPAPIAPLQPLSRFRPTAPPVLYRRPVRRRLAIVPTPDSTTLYITPSANTMLVPTRVITKVIS